MMETIPYSPDALRLLHDGAVALAEVEANGIAVDVPYLESALRKSERRVKRLRAALDDSDVMKAWRKRFGARVNLNSAEQLGKILFEDLGFKSEKATKTGKYATDEESLESVNHPFIKNYLEIKKIEKASGTYLKAILREQVNGRLHCFFNLHTTTTFRSSSDTPNFQNIPVRDKATMRLVRRALVARKGRQIVEIDFKGAEVCVGACYHKDKNMIRYILDKQDMHRDAAADLFCLPPDAVPKPLRQLAKGAFVFAEFYGDWYKRCAANIWKHASGLEAAEGVSVYKHLARNGIKELGACDPEQEPAAGTFEAHVKRAEDALWKKRFPGYAKWKRDWYEAYRRQGWFATHTGFICKQGKSGIMSKNDAVNYPIQGSSFHCLLWSLTRLVRVEMRKRKMRTLIVGQIHDSIVADAVPAELDEFIALCREIITNRLPAVWPWLVVPLETETEIAPVGGSWADKAPYER